MINVYLYLRYIVFGCFVASNAIIASVSVWNLSLLQLAGVNAPVVSYLISVGALALAFIFAIIFVELARRNSPTSRVCYEVCWVSLFSILELAGAVAYSALIPPEMCSLKERKIAASCVSTRVLQAFTFIVSLTLLCYLLTLSFCCLRHGKSAWRSRIHDLFSLSCEPPTPHSASRFLCSTLAAPQPRRAQHLEWTYRSGLNPDYEIEHYQPPAPPMPTVSSSFSHRHNTFYSDVVQSSLPVQPPFIAESSQSASPLGDWPRKDILQRPLPSRKPVETVPSRRRPTGPRKQSGEEKRPPPLDLSNITSFRLLPP